MILFNKSFDYFLNSNIELISGIFILAIYIFAGYNKLISFNNTQSGITSKITSIINIDIPKFFYFLITLMVIVIEIVIPILIIYSKIGNNNKTKDLISKYGIIILIFFTILVTLLYHNPIYGSERISFLKNLSIIGALFLMLKFY